MTLEQDVERDVFASFTKFRSTQFFVRDFEDNAELLTALPEQEVEEVSWWEQDSGLGMPNWAMVLIVFLLVSGLILSAWIIVVMNRNRKDRQLQERAIMAEL